MISKDTYEDFLKNRVARELDRIREELREEERVIAEDETLQNQIERLQKQYQRITFGLPPKKADEIVRRIREFLDRPDGSRKDVLMAFLDVDDQNFERRYAFFYDEIAPLMDLYWFDVGETVTVQAFSDRGFARAANVKIWGTYSFEGLEDAELAGSVNLVDLMTFRQLYGVLGEEEREELEQIRRDVGVEDIDRDEAESALFGGGDSLVVEGEETAEEDDSIANIRDAREQMASAEQTYSQADLDNGPARNAAIILEDPSRIEETRADIERVIRQKDLGLQVIDWQKAAGIVGQFVTVIQLALFTSIGVIFLVALVIINNSMVMATVERIDEIGTMRAIGAQRWYVMLLFLFETLLIGAAAGLAGCGLGALSVFILGQTGVPATTDFLRFLFAGDYLYPTLEASHVMIGFAVIMVVSAISTFYPARLATRVQPVVAMRGN